MTRIGNHAPCFRGYARAGGGAPRRWNEAWWTMLREQRPCAARLVTAPRDALGAILAGKNALLFLLLLLALSLLVGRAAFFEWAAIPLRARCQGRRALALSKCVCCRARSLRAILSLDTTAVMLTPGGWLALVKRLKVPRRRTWCCARLSPTWVRWRLAHQQSHQPAFRGCLPTDLCGLRARMIAPQLVALATTFAVPALALSQGEAAADASKGVAAGAGERGSASGLLMVCIAVLAGRCSSAIFLAAADGA